MRLRATSSRTPAWFSTYSNSLVRYAGLMLTRIAPILAVAHWVNSHSGAVRRPDADSVPLADAGREQPVRDGVERRGTPAEHAPSRRWLASSRPRRAVGAVEPVPAAVSGLSKPRLHPGRQGVRVVPGDRTRRSTARRRAPQHGDAALFGVPPAEVERDGHQCAGRAYRRARVRVEPDGRGHHAPHRATITLRWLSAVLTACARWSLGCSTSGRPGR